MFFSFDGIDGTGKSTQMARFASYLQQRGHQVVTCRDPGSTELGEKLRDILLHRAEIPLGRRAEMFLYMAARAQLVDAVIRPAIDAGKVVVCDRFLLANVVYQGYAGGLEVEDLWRVGEVAVCDVRPDLVFVLDLDVAEASRRMGSAPDRMESQGRRFMEQVRQGYLQEAARRSEVTVIDASPEIETVQAEIRKIAEPRLPAINPPLASGSRA